MQCNHCNEMLDVSACTPFAQVACPHCDAVNRVPAQLGPFRLLETLGLGGMGAVYKARDLTLNRLVAIKVMRKEYGDDDEFLTSFLQEARAAAALNHRNVAQIYSYGQEKGQPYIVMELLESGRLDKMIEGKKPLGEAFVMSTAVHVAEGLQAANEIGLIHGDIKPANILFNEKGVAKVVDFGLARFSKAHQPKPGEVWGTPYYIAPEKVRGKASDHRADIYSLGGTLFHALAKTAPFEGETARDVVKARLDKPAPSILEYRPNLTAETESVIARMLERSTARRYPTYASLLSDLHTADRASQKAARDRKRIEAAAAVDAARAARRKPVIVSTLITLLLAFAVGGAWWWQAATKPEERKIDHLVIQPNGRVVPVYEDELEDEGAIQPVPATNQTGTVEVASLSAAQQELQETAISLATDSANAARDRLAALVARLDDEDPNRAQAQLLQGVAAWIDGRPDDADSFVGGIPESAPGAVRQLAAYLSGTTTRAELEAARSGWTPGPRALTDFLLGLSALHQGQVDRAATDFKRYLDASTNGWWTGLQPLVPRLQSVSDDWLAVEKTLPADRPQDALSQLRTFLAGDPAALRPVADKTMAELEQRIRTQEQDQERIRAATDATAELIVQERYAEATDAIERAMGGLETPEARTTLEAELSRLKRLASVRIFLTEQLTASPFPQGITELGGRIVRTTSEKIFIERIDGREEKAWSDISPTLYLNLLEYAYKKAKMENGQRADVALSIAYYWHTQKREQVALRCGRLALELNPDLREEAEALMPGLDFSLPPRGPAR